ncbi:DUF6786 family protein [Maribacter ulvicola]|uniref:Methane oxygenase PmoA n=1 Tax=Maribacter ulvicola TaxID=228959 RepID=A0A1N6NHQ8_9FLAO|nr:DUF6786 family protein [Maribacter ulvicola]SIP91658.1 hypothetical protein SAMN05421797_1011 [Maribacter ulvicola]
MKNLLYLVFILLTLNACNKNYDKGTFGYDVDFLNKNLKTVVLKNNNDKRQLVVVPDYQGRVMTSTSNGLNGKSYGWINYDLISSNKLEEHINIFGGEDRFWLGPEGGQYSIFFKKGDDFTIDKWFTPKPIDTESFSLVKNTDTSVTFNKEMQLTNYQGYEFDINVERTISLLEVDKIQENLQIDINDNISFVGFQSENKMTNLSETWSKDNGLLSIWILGMFVPSENTTVIIPYKDSLELNTRYFGEISSDRLAITNNAVLFKGDGKYRCKIGLPAKNALSVFGSYDAKNNVLTIVKYSRTEETSYVNSLWEYQDNPYEGDVINTYNDGAMKNGEQLGPFYELESSSAAIALKRGNAIKHIHQTYHFEGDFESINKIAKKILAIDLDEISFQK